MSDNSKKTTQYEDFQAAWQWWLKYGGIGQQDDQWETAIREANALRKAHGDRKFFRELIQCVANEIERRSKGAMG